MPITMNSPLVDLEPPTGELAQDLDTCEVELTDGSTVHFELRIEPDFITFEDIEDPAVFGWVEVVHNSSERPDGFDGAARKLHLGNNHPSPYATIWYQPPDDLKRDPGALAKHLNHVWDILAWGYRFVSVEMTHTLPNGYSNSWSAGLGAIEPFPERDFLVELADDLVADLTTQLKETS